ncbi:hypothetical protein GCM10020000_87610 [Streptomyces olivoverticillatus]
MPGRAACRARTPHRAAPGDRPRLPRRRPGGGPRPPRPPPAQQALLDALTATALGALPSTTPARQAADAIQEVCPDGSLRVRHSDEADTGALLDRLADRALVELDSSSGHPYDVLVTITARGRRHATVTAGNTAGTNAAHS